MITAWRERIHQWWQSPALLTYRKTLAARQPLTRGLILPELLGLTVPIAWGLFTVLGCNVVDAMLVSHLGSLPMAAYTVTFPLALVASNVGSASSLAITALVGRELGRAHRDRARELTTDSMLAVVIVSTAFVLTLLLGQSWALPIFSINVAEQALLAEFLPVYLPSLIMLLISITGGAALRAAGNTVWPSTLMSWSAILTILLDFVLIRGYEPLGMPALGLQGVAWASLFAKGLAAIATIIVLFRAKLLGFGGLRPIPERFADCCSMAAIAVPALIGQLILPFSVSVLTRMVGSYGEEAVAAYGLAYRLESFALIGFLALSSAVLPFLSQNFGRSNNAGRMQEGLVTSIGLCFWIGLLSLLGLLLLVPLILRFMQPDAAMLPFIKTYLSLVPFSYWGVGLVLVVSNALFATQRPVQGVLVSAIRLLAFVLPGAMLGERIAISVTQSFPSLQTGLMQIQQANGKELIGLLGVFAGLAVGNVLAGWASLMWSNNLLQKKQSAAMEQAAAA